MASYIYSTEPEVDLDEKSTGTYRIVRFALNGDDVDESTRAVLDTGLSMEESARLLDTLNKEQEDLEEIYEDEGED